MHSCGYFYTDQTTGTATSADYGDAQHCNVIFSNSQFSADMDGHQHATADVTFTPTDDSLVEPHEMLTLQLERASGYGFPQYGLQAPDGTVEPITTREHGPLPRHDQGRRHRPAVDGGDLDAVADGDRLHGGGPLWRGQHDRVHRHFQQRGDGERHAGVRVRAGHGRQAGGLCPGFGQHRTGVLLHGGGGRHGQRRYFLGGEQDRKTKLGDHPRDGRDHGRGDYPRPPGRAFGPQGGRLPGGGRPARGLDHGGA